MAVNRACNPIIDNEDHVLSGVRDKMNVGDTASRTYLADTHIASAFLMAQRANECEVAGTQAAASSRLRSECHAAVCGSVLLSAAFLEAFINELLADAGDMYGMLNSLTALPRDAYRRLALLWREGVPRRAGYSILEKYQLTLIVADKLTFDEGRSPFRDVHALVTLRNALIHYEPEWIIRRVDRRAGAENHKLTRLLRDKFPTSPFVHEGDPWYPQHCLSAGCAHWAAHTALRFARVFLEQLALSEPGSRLRGRLPDLVALGIDLAELE